MPENSIEQLLDTIANSLSGLFTPENLRSYLDASQSVQGYSERNKLLILSRYPDTVKTESFEGWKQKGRYVKKGEKGIEIFAPKIVKLQKNQMPDGTDIVTETLKFVPAFVFDLSQTEGAEFAAEETEKKRFEDEFIYDSLRSMTPYKIQFGSAECCDDRRQEITFKMGLSDTEILQSLLRHIVHIAVKKEQRERWEKEILEEGVFYLLAVQFGLKTTLFAFESLTQFRKEMEWQDRLILLEKISESARRISARLNDRLEAIDKKKDGETKKKLPLNIRIKLAEEEAALRIIERRAQLERRSVF